MQTCCHLPRSRGISIAHLSDHGSRLLIDHLGSRFTVGFIERRLALLGHRECHSTHFVVHSICGHLRDENRK